MRESRRYLNFFKRNALVLLIPTILAPLFFYFYQLNFPRVYEVEKMYEVNYEVPNISEKVILGDEIVTILRSNNLKRELLGDTSDEVIVYKSGPLSIILNVSSASEKSLGRSAEKYDNFLTKSYEVRKLGIDTYFTKGPDKIPFIVFSSFGLMLGFLVSLVREYFLKY